METVDGQECGGCSWGTLGGDLATNLGIEDGRCMGAFSGAIRGKQERSMQLAQQEEGDFGREAP